MHAFLRFSGGERLLIVNSFSSSEMDIKIKIPDDLFHRMGIAKGDEYFATDILWGNVVVSFGKDLTLPVPLPPHGSFIFKLT